MLHADALPALARLSIRVAYGVALHTTPHDVFLLAAPLAAAARPFDPAESLGLVLTGLARPETEALVVHLGRTHRTGAQPTAEAQIAITLATDPTGVLPDQTVEAVGSSFRAVLEQVCASTTGAFDHDQAHQAAVAAVQSAYPAVQADSLALTVEEHLNGIWTLRLTDHAMATYITSLGFVDGNLATTHVRRQAPGEVVDSVGPG